MPSQKRFKTSYPGVYYIEGNSLHGTKADRIFYIRFRRDGKSIEEKAGRASKDMTAARANMLRAAKMDGKKPTNKENRKAKNDRWTITRLWGSYTANRPNLKGIITDDNRFENHIKPVFGDKLPSEIDPLSIDRLRIKLLKKKSPGTVKNIFELLRRICNYATKKRLTPGLSFALEMPKVNNLRTEDVTLDQLKALLEAMDNDINEQAANLMRMALYSGMRRSELFKLKWSDIDQQRGFIKLENPKGGADVSIPLNNAAKKLLRKHPKTGSKYIFPGRGGKERKDIHNQVNRIRDNAGLPKSFRALHGLRHVYASMLASSGKVDLYTLQRLLTHKSPQMTMRYAHLRDSALKEASQVAGDIISSVAKEKVVKMEDNK